MAVVLVVQSLAIRRSPFDTQTLHLGSSCARQYSKSTFTASPITSGEVVDMPLRNQLVYVDGIEVGGLTSFGKR